ncbi:oocyte zinc finger protein XlCOF6-like [Arapaima gigas]
MSSFQTQIASIMEILVQTALAEMRKVVAENCGLLALRLETSQRQSENKSSKVETQLMESEFRESLASLCELWMTQFSSMMGVLAQEAVNKICSLVAKELSTLPGTVTQRQNENESLKMKVQLMEQELRTAERHGEHPAGLQDKCVNSLTVTLQVDDELRQVKKVPFHTVSEEECSDSISQDVESLPVVEENVALQSVVLMGKFQDMKDRIESVIVKEEVLEECLDGCVFEEGLHISAEGVVELCAQTGENQPPVEQDSEEESPIAAEVIEDGTQPKPELNLDVQNTHGVKLLRITRNTMKTVSRAPGRHTVTIPGPSSDMNSLTDQRLEFGGS